MKTSREQARTVNCPTCGAQAGELCIRKDGVTPRERTHMDRFAAFDQQQPTSEKKMSAREAKRRRQAQPPEPKRWTAKRAAGRPRARHVGNSR